MAAEVKRANEIDAVIGHVAPTGMAALYYTDSGQASSKQIEVWPKQQHPGGESKDLERLASDLLYLHSIVCVRGIKYFTSLIELCDQQYKTKIYNALSWKTKQILTTVTLEPII